MAKLVTFFLFLFIGASMLSAVMEGGGGILTTTLTADIDDDDVIIPVADTEMYLGADYIVIGDEEILYTGKTAVSFTGVTRGYHGTTPADHADGANVYTKESSTINNALGFSTAAEADSMGWWAVITIPWNFLFKTLPNIIMMNFSFLSGDLAVLGYFFFAMAAGFVISIAIALAGGRRV